ncbi:MAG: hypothetical protein M3Q56_06445, partial [Bacteroidota bacterium]|nr:hypothetical protein [Bacteroidota bacterium]
HGEFDSLDKWDPRYGYFSFGGLGKIPDQPYWYTWSPLQQATFFNNNSALFLPGNSDLILHMHYGPTGKPLKDSSEIHLWFSSQPDRFQIHTAPLINPYGLTNGTFYLPANTKKTFHSDYTLPFDIQVLSITPQSNLFCRSWELYAKIPKNEVPVKLVKIRDWNFNWKQTYRPSNPIILPAGTIIHALANFDNTTENPCNPSDKPSDVIWGAHLFSDLFMVHFEYLPTKSLGDDIKMYIPSVVSGNELPIQLEALKKGNYTFEITSIGGKRDPQINGFILKSGKQKFTVPIKDLVNGNYLLTIHNEANTVLAQSLFIKMWDKGL